MLGYALLRPVSEALFLEYYHAERLPQAWILVGVIILALVKVNDCLARRLRPASVLGVWAMISLVVTVFHLVLLKQGVKEASYTLLLWKDGICSVLVVGFWSLANVYFQGSGSAAVYGGFLFSGTVGSIAGNLLVPFFVRWFGSVELIWLQVPILFAVLVISGLLQGRLQTQGNPPPRIFTGSVLKLLLNSRALPALFGMVLCEYITLTLFEFQYNRMVEQAFPVLDERTAFGGWVYACMETLSLCGPLLMGLFIARIGFQRVLQAGIGWGLVASTAFFIMPGLLVAVLAKVVLKAMNYSVLRGGRELLYQPLSYDEKTLGKPWVDNTGGRLAKTIGALMLLAVPQASLAGWGSLVLGTLLLWGYFSRQVLSEHRHATNSCADVVSD